MLNTHSFTNSRTCKFGVWVKLCLNNAEEVLTGELLPELRSGNPTALEQAHVQYEKCGREAATLRISQATRQMHLKIK